MTELRSHCRKGHLYTEKNTYWMPPHPVNGKRYRSCRRCHAERNLQFYYDNAEYREKQIIATRVRCSMLRIECR